MWHRPASNAPARSVNPATWPLRDLQRAQARGSGRARSTPCEDSQPSTQVASGPACGQATVQLDG